MYYFRTDELDDSTNKATYERHFGRSLMAAYTDHYMSDFVLHGTSDTNFHSRLHNDLRMSVQVSLPTYHYHIYFIGIRLRDLDYWKRQPVKSKITRKDRQHWAMKPISP